ncbi:MAG TPA: alpha-L-fucosidase [Bryobacteraceae bacterium]|nr:alpha-L-fucosidase [Bryobacteraceae bacterium]
MMRCFFLSAVMAGALGASSLTVQSPPAAVRGQWFQDARFGMFIHWGVYSLVGEGEWVQQTKMIPPDEYEKLGRQFNPVHFDAKAWVDLARAAGMKYMVVTTKHHDGFCLFDTKLTDWNVMKTPFRRDIVAELTSEAQRQGLTMGYYYSILDWHHPDYLPRHAWDKRPAADADLKRYLAYARGQVKELLSRSRGLGSVWFDGSWEHTAEELQSSEMISLIHSLQPNALINNRLNLEADFSTPEQFIPAVGLKNPDGSDRRWENCLTMTSHWWGYDRLETDYKPADQLIRTLVDVASKGGNLLLNIGPRPDGTIQQEFIDRLYAIGRWMAVNGEAIYGTSASPFPRLPFYGRCTSRPGTLYFHVYTWPADGKLVIPGLKNRVKSAYLLHDRAQPLGFQQGGDTWTIYVPREAPDPVASVVAVEIEGAPAIRPMQLSSDGDGRIDLPVLHAEIRSQHGQRMQFGVEGREVHTASWTRPVDFVYWEFEAKQGGDYQVQLTYSCDEKQGGGEFGISALPGGIAEPQKGVGSTARRPEIPIQLYGSVQDTGSWSAYHTVASGTVKLEQGKNGIVVRPVHLPRGHLMNLSRVRLIPVAQAGAPAR